MRAVLALILGLSLAGAGAAHRPVERPGEAAALALFLQAGGSLADLCHDAGGADHGGDHGRMDCPACTLQKAGCIVSVAVLPAMVLTCRVEPVVIPVSRLARAVAQGERPPARGPPEPFLS